MSAATHRPAGTVGLTPDLPRPVAIWPAADKLPANILRFYVQFSSPAEADFERSQLRLCTDAGELVPDAFLVLNEELWSPDGCRLTLFIEPGRIKRDMGAAHEHPPALVPGCSYRLEVAMPGGPLVKAFEVVRPMTEPMSELHWDVAAPAAGSRQSLTIIFDRLMDEAILSDELDIRGLGGMRIEGTQTLVDGRTLLFTPLGVWEQGSHHIVVSALLEDVCGNRIDEALDHLASQRQRSRGGHLEFRAL